MAICYLTAYTALIPRDATIVDPTPTEFRPLTVLSGIYRLWSTARFIAALSWQGSGLERVCLDAVGGATLYRP